MDTWLIQYLDYFDLQRQPFQITHTPSFFWQGPKQQAALSELRRGLFEQKGSVLLTGPAGSGKTPLARKLSGELSCKHLYIKIPDAGMDSLNFFKLMSKPLQVKNSFVSRGGFLVQVRNNLHSDLGPDHQIVLTIDDAHLLDADLLESLRMLADIKVREHRLIRFFFVARSRFVRLLDSLTDQTLCNLIVARARLESLSNKDTADYIRDCLKEAGAGGPVFDVSAEIEVFRLTRGNLLLIDPVCELSMLTALGRGKRQVTNRIVGECARALGLPARQVDSKVFLNTAGRLIKGKKLGLETLAGKAKSAPLPAENQTSEDRSKSQTTNQLREISGLGGDEAADLKPCSDYLKSNSVLKYAGMGLVALMLLGFGIYFVMDTKTGELDLDQTQASMFAPFKQEGTEISALADKKPATANTGREDDRIPAIFKQEVIRFKDDPNEILPNNIDALFRIADYLAEHPDIKTTLRGYCDVVGANENNLNLSRFQANVIKSYLVAKGISPDRIRALALGSAYPAAPDQHKDGKLPKRSVIIELSDSGEFEIEAKNKDMNRELPASGNRLPLP